MPSGWPRSTMYLVSLDFWMASVTSCVNRELVNGSCWQLEPRDDLENAYETYCRTSMTENEFLR
jgi:hypothetical protein